jgi:hypothetical protein
MLYWLGVKPSYSRPRVSYDNAYAEALTRAAKYRPEFPVRDFADLVQACQGTDQFDDVRVGDHAMLPNAHFLEAQLRVVAATPMQEQSHLPFVSGHEDFGEHRTQDALLQLRRVQRMLPQAVRFGAQGKKRPLRRPVRRRTPRASAIPRCIRRRRATSGTLG